MELKNQSDYERYIKQDNLGEYYVVLNQFTFHSVYQPIFDKHQRIIGMEALLRIRGIDGSLIRPDVFLANNGSIPTFDCVLSFYPEQCTFEILHAVSQERLSNCFSMSCLKPYSP